MSTGTQTFGLIDPTSGDDDPTIVSGSTGNHDGYNFSIVRNKEGQFTVTFQPSLNSVPAVVATVAGSTTTLDNVVIDTISTETFDLYVGDHEGDRKDFKFSFLAVAPS